MIKKTVLWMIKAYSFLISPLVGANCRFHPTCSDYTRQAIEKYGVIKGGYFGVRRIGKCHPWYHGKHHDPVP